MPCCLSVSLKTTFQDGWGAFEGPAAASDYTLSAANRDHKWVPLYFVTMSSEVPKQSGIGGFFQSFSILDRGLQGIEGLQNSSLETNCYLLGCLEVKLNVTNFSCPLLWFCHVCQAQKFKK
jgi:hypothetical protein